MKLGRLIFKKKTDSMFTVRSQSERGIMATALGIIAAGSLVIAIMIAFSNRGMADMRLGSAGLVSCIISVAGLVIGIVSLTEKDKYNLFPCFGVAFNSVSLLIWGWMIYIGIYGM